ncbi:SpoVA/SpoVAEb family sporulation membrane protein [Massilibacterium senegalense]|uniref:SpoVA/SpoVAEb family sporulation membrane protein n=1 Tax=Massilibacterium senegalense TaxID=1632858 RepID=UPI0011C75B02|nr:SpoVA/SpoVAEb family sporulation membrane protein [Massilibacterium senegalense]
MNQTQLYKRTVSATKPKEPIGTRLFLSFVLSGLLSVLTECGIILIQRIFLVSMDIAIYSVIIAWMVISLLGTKMYLFRKLSFLAAGGIMFSILGFFNVVFSAAIDARKEGWIKGATPKIFEQIAVFLMFYYFVQWIFLSKG